MRVYIVTLHGGDGPSKLHVDETRAHDVQVW